MQRLSDISTIRAVMEKNGFSFSKALGQNFLINPSVCPRMAEMSGAADCAGAIEVGPGIGVLTYELSQVSKKVVTIELDKRLLPVLDETLADCDNVKVINDDVMKIDLHRVIEEEFNGEEVAVCANRRITSRRPVIHEAFGRSFAHHEHHGYGTKRSGRAFVCTARHARVRRCQCGRAVLRRAGNFVRGQPRQLYARTECGFRCHSAAYSKRTARGRAR